MQDLNQLLEELKAQSFFNEGEICVIGCSTSEVQGERIGTTGSIDVAQEIFEALLRFNRRQVFHLHFKVVNISIVPLLLNVKTLIHT